MTSLINNDLKLPHEIGCFIASQTPYLDCSCEGHPWAEHKGQFESGPNPFYSQMRQGLILEVINHNHRPRSICTKYGEWIVLGSCMGDFDRIFKVLQETLKLRKIGKGSDIGTSYWAIQRWNGKTLEDPVKADRAEFISHKIAKEAYREFTENL